MMRAILFIIMLLLSYSPASAVVFGGTNLGFGGYPSNECNKPLKPTKPYSFSNDWEIDRYNSEVDYYNTQLEEYSTCLREYIDNAQTDIQRIKEKIQESINGVGY